LHRGDVAPPDALEPVHKPPAGQAGPVAALQGAVGGRPVQGTAPNQGVAATVALPPLNG
jgi:hypothetical protein